MKKQALEDALAERLARQGLLPLFERQYRFDPTRKWRFDFYSDYYRLALEVEGGTFQQGRHSRGLGMRNDMEKYNEAALQGIRVLRFDAHMILPPPFHRHKARTKKAYRQRVLEGSAMYCIRRALLADFAGRGGILAADGHAPIKRPPRVSP